MTTYNLKIALEKAIEILPTQLEIEKLVNTLSDEEQHEFTQAIMEHPITKEINKIFKLKLQKVIYDKTNNLLIKHAGAVVSPISNNSFERYDPLTDILGSDFMHEILNDIREENKDKDDLSKETTSKSHHQLTKLFVIKFFTKIASDDKALDNIIESIRTPEQRKDMLYDPKGNNKFNPEELR